MIRRFQGTPFILNKFQVRNNSYLNHHLRSEMNSGLIDNAGGVATRINKISAIKASIGEHLERICSVLNYTKINNDYETPFIECFNLLNGETTKVEAEKVFLNFNLPMFRNLVNKESLFNDSNGLASHIYSFNAIENGFKEFIERQSLIFNWLTKNPGERINYELLKNNNQKYTNVLKLLHIAKSLSDEMFSFNISIVEGMFVIFTIGYKRNAFSAGLGADFDLNSAIESSLNEYLMILESSIALQANPENNNLSININKYAFIFYNMKIKQFIDDYEYLFNSKIVFNEALLLKKFDFNEVLLRVNQELNLNVFTCFLPHPIGSIDVKVVKVFSLEAYPSLDTELFDPSDFKISQYLPKREFYNKFKPIPFA